MNDQDRLETVRKILQQVASYEDDSYYDCGKCYWGMDTSMDAESVEARALEALKEFEQKAWKEGYAVGLCMP